MLNFLNSTPVRLATFLLLVQVAIFYGSARPENVPEGQPLSEVPASIDHWTLRQEGVIEKEVRDVLKADDLLNRDYVDASKQQAVNLFIASFRSQRNGKAPHSPKNCLPGNGWTPLRQDILTIDVGESAPIPVNRYVIEHAENRSLVLYWYQSRDRAVADEYRAKFWVVADAMRYNRTDTALIRIVVPMRDRNEDAATNAALDFAKSFYGAIRRVLPA
jgi:EpsI family protein